MILRAFGRIVLNFVGKPEMARAACTQIVLRTTVMIGALVVLLMMALLPGPVRWLLGPQQQPAAARDEPGRQPTAEAKASDQMGETAGAGLGAEFTRAIGGPAIDVALPERSEQGAAGEPLGKGKGGRDESPDRYGEITSELRELGAAYYRLEAWEGQTNVFRFQCTLRAGEPGEDGKQEYRTFEAAGGEPAAAMQRVLADVRAWRNGGLY
jgi:hypothetical protein